MNKNNITNNNYQTELNDLYPIDNIFKLRSARKQKDFIKNNSHSELNNISIEYNKAIIDLKKNKIREFNKKYYANHRSEIIKQNRLRYYNKNRSKTLLKYSNYLINQSEVLI